MPHGKIYDRISDTIGHTPLVRLSRLMQTEGIKAEILGKLEFFNPGGSVKDRIGLSMIDDMERQGRLKPGSTIIEPTSGNTGIALAMVAAERGYRMIVVMPESMSMERRKMMVHLGAELVLTPADEGMKGAISRADELATTIPGALVAQQFENPANPDVHMKTTAREILTDTGGALDAFISGVGTGGTLTGCATVLKAALPDVKICAVEPEDSPVIAGGQPGPHSIQGIGAGFIPDNLSVALVDEVFSIGNLTAFETARKLASLEGIAAGISSGAALAAAFELAERPEMAGKRIVVILPSFAERYLSTALFDDE